LELLCDGPESGLCVCWHLARLTTPRVQWVHKHSGKPLGRFDGCAQAIPTSVQRRFLRILPPSDTYRSPLSFPHRRLSICRPPRHPTPLSFNLLRSHQDVRPWWPARLLLRQLPPLLLLLLLCAVHLPRPLLLSLPETGLHVQALTGRVDDQPSPAWSTRATRVVLRDGQAAGIEPLVAGATQAARRCRDGTGATHAGQGLCDSRAGTS